MRQEEKKGKRIPCITLYKSNAAKYFTNAKCQEKILVSHTYCALLLLLLSLVLTLTLPPFPRNGHPITNEPSHTEFEVRLELSFHARCG